MGQEGVYSKVEVLRKKRVGSVSVLGTTQTVGSGLKPRRMGFWNVGVESGILWWLCILVGGGDVVRYYTCTTQSVDVRGG